MLEHPNKSWEPPRGAFHTVRPNTVAESNPSWTRQPQPHSTQARSSISQGGHGLDLHGARASPQVRTSWGARTKSPNGRLKSPPKSPSRGRIGLIPDPPSMEVLMGLEADKRCIMSEAIVKDKRGKSRLDVSLWSELQNASGQAREAAASRGLSRQLVRGPSNVWNILNGSQRSSPPGSPDRARQQRARQRTDSNSAPLELGSGSGSGRKIGSMSFSEDEGLQGPQKVDSPRVKEIKGDPDLVKRARRLRGDERARSVMLTADEDLIVMAANFGILPSNEDEEGNSSGQIPLMRKSWPTSNGRNLTFRSTLKTDQAAEAVAHQQAARHGDCESVNARSKACCAVAPKRAPVAEENSSSELGGRPLLPTSTLNRRSVKRSTTQKANKTPTTARQDYTGLHGVSSKSADYASTPLNASVQPVWASPSNTSEFVSRVVNTDTSVRKCRYFDLLDRSEQGPPEFYISHCWAGNFRELVMSVHQYFTARVPALNMQDTFVWIVRKCRYFDLPVRSEQGTPEFYISHCWVGNFRELVMTVDHYLTARVPALNMQDTHDRGKVIVLPSHWDWNDIQAGFLLMSIDESVASNADDQVTLMRDLNKTGFSNVVGGFTDAMLRHSRRELARAEHVVNLNPRWCAILSNFWVHTTYIYVNDRITNHTHARAVLRRLKDTTIRALEVTPSPIATILMCLTSTSWSHASTTLGY
eukprot:gene4016-14095_t